MKTIEILQREYGIANNKNGCKLLGTTNIWICTAWYGYDAENRVAFLCHFDSPFSIKSLPIIILRLKKLAPDHNFKTSIVGGTNWSWSPVTRFLLNRELRKMNGIEVDSNNSSWNPVKHFTVSINSETGEVGTYHPKPQIHISIKNRWSHYKLLFSCKGMRRAIGSA